MSCEEAIYSILTNDSDVSALVSTRIYPNLKPQSASLPAIVYSQGAGPRDHTMDGPSGLVGVILAIKCWASSYGGTRQLADKVRAALNGYSGTAAGTLINAMIMRGQTDIIEQLADIRGARQYSKSMQFFVQFQE